MPVLVKLFKPEDNFTNEEVNQFVRTHNILRVERFPHAKKAGIGNYIALTYKVPDEVDSEDTDPLAPHMHN